MYRVYEVVEVLPNGSRQTVTVVPSLESAKAALEDLAKRTHDECLVVDAKTHQVVMQLNECRVGKGAGNEESFPYRLRRGTSASKNTTPKVARLYRNVPNL